MPQPAIGMPATPLPGPQRPGRLRRYGPRLLLAGLAAMVTLKLADVVVGSVANTRERHLLRLVPGASLRHRSNEFDYVFRTNRLGLRGPDVAFAKPAGTFRIVVLGDSFVAGYGVPEEHLLTTLLQDRLAMERPADRKTAGSGFSRVEVVNVGRVGTSTIRELDLYEILGRRFEPDLVILAYYLGNDLAEIIQEQTRAELEEWHPGGWSRRLAFAWFPNLYLELAMIRQSRWQKREFTRRDESEIVQDLENEVRARGRDPSEAVARFEALSSKIRRDVAEGMLSEQRIIDSCIDPERLERALNGSARDTGGAWARTADHLGRLHHAVARDRAHLVVVAIPAPFQIDPGSLDFHRALGYQVHENWLERQPDTTVALENWARSASVPFLDLIDPIRHSEQPLYFVEDEHFTPQGHAAAAEAISRFLVSRGLCP